jgi:hypothetical protein
MPLGPVRAMVEHKGDVQSEPQNPKPVYTGRVGLCENSLTARASLGRTHEINYRGMEARSVSEGECRLSF